MILTNNELSIDNHETMYRRDMTVFVTGDLDPLKHWLYVAVTRHQWRVVRSAISDKMIWCEDLTSGVGQRPKWTVSIVQKGPVTGSTTRTSGEGCRASRAVFSRGAWRGYSILNLALSNPCTKFSFSRLPTASDTPNAPSLQ